MRFFACIFFVLVVSPAWAGEDISLRSGKDSIRAYLCRPDKASAGARHALVVLHGDFGLTKWVKQQCRRLADKGYVTLAVDLYRGELPKNVEEAHILERAIPDERALADIKAAADYLSRRKDVRKDRLGVLGWEMGGGHALEAALHDPRFRAVVVCYGRLVTDPVPLKKLNGSVLGIFAAKDEGMPAETLRAFENAMKKAGKRLAGMHVLAGAGTGFMDPDSPYREGPVAHAALTEAWRHIDGYLAAELQTGR